MSVEIVVPLVRPSDVFVATDDEAMDRGLEVSADLWIVRRALSDRSLRVTFSDEQETYYEFADSAYMDTFIEYMDK